MASTSGGGSADVHTGRVSYHRSGSSTRSITINPVEHLQTIQSGIPTQDWDNVTQFRPTWVPRNDSMKGHYAGSVANKPRFTKTLKRGVGVYDYRKADVWRAAAMELVATAGFTFLSITAYQLGSNTSVAARAFLQALIYSLAILAAAPISGGHLNPAITFTTFLTGRATLVRSFLYIVAQCSGGIGGAAAVRFLTTQEARNIYSMGGCLVQELPVEGVAMAATSALNNKQGLVAEAIFTLIMLFVVYGIGFDTRSVVVTFPIISPFIIGGVFGVLIFISQGLGYTAAMNPARCLGPAVMYRPDLWDSLCTFTIGPVIAAVVVGIFQLLVQQANNAEFGPVLPLNFFQAVIPDHQCPGFGPRSTSNMYNYPTEDIAHSQHFGPNFPAMASSEFQLPSEPNSASKYNLTLQIKAFMQPKGSESRRASAANIVDVARFDQNLMLQQYSNSCGSSADGVVHHAGNPEKER